MPYGTVSRTSGHHVRTSKAGHGTARPRTRTAVMTNAIAPAGIVVARNGVTPAPASTSATISTTAMNWRRSSSADTQPRRSSTCSGTVSSDWPRTTTIPRPASAVPATSDAG